jgi:hypothetical protein
MNDNFTTDLTLACFLNPPCAQPQNGNINIGPAH